MSDLNSLLFGIYPYIAIAVFFIGCWVRYDREPYTWKADSSQLLDQKGFRVASNLFHVGIIFVLCGHFVGLLAPEAIYHIFISSANKQLLAMISGGFFGVLCLIGLVSLLVIGPEKLPKVARIAGYWIGKTRHVVASVKEEIKEELKEEELRQIVKEQQAHIDSMTTKMDLNVPAETFLDVNSVDDENTHVGK